MANEIFEHLKVTAPFKMEFLDENKNFHQSKSYVKKIFDECFLIETPKAKEGVHKIPESSEINIIFNRNDGVLIARCRVLGEETGSEPALFISFPIETTILERRECIRIPLKVKMEIVCTSSLGKTAFHIMTRNISGSGIAFFHNHSLKDYEDISCKLYLKDENPEPVYVKCKWVYSKKVKTKNGISFLTALTYTAISDEDTSRIVKECFKYQINRKHIDKA